LSYYERKKFNFPVLSFDVAVRFSPVWFGFFRFGSQLVNRRETMVRFVNLWYGSVIFGLVRFGLAVRFSFWFLRNSPKYYY
jgi:hypothetical protein